MHEGSGHQHLTGANAGVGEPLAVPKTRICEYRACLRRFPDEIVAEIVQYGEPATKLFRSIS
jgi:hypothetical protein